MSIKNMNLPHLAESLFVQGSGKASLIESDFSIWAALSLWRRRRAFPRARSIITSRNVKPRLGSLIKGLPRHRRRAYYAWLYDVRASLSSSHNFATANHLVHIFQQKHKTRRDKEDLKKALLKIKGCDRQGDIF